MRHATKELKGNEVEKRSISSITPDFDSQSATTDFQTSRRLPKIIILEIYVPIFEQKGVFILGVAFYPAQKKLHVVHKQGHNSVRHDELYSSCVGPFPRG